jgi:CheY-like chemotaxis protein
MGNGATFFAAIPINFSGQTEAVYVPDSHRDLDVNRLPILVVEDNKEALFIYEKYLKGTRFQIVPATSLQEARRALREFRPSAVILDVLLQGEHSWDLLQEIKLSPATRAIPVFVVTVIDNREKAFALGADGFHPKPIERTWLIRELERACNEPKKRLLIVDDDEVSRYLVRTILGNRDFVIAEAASGQEGLRRATDEPPDVMVLDLMMPDMSGYEVLSRLKADQRTAGIPVIIHTSKILDARDRELLRDATAIVSKESKSKEVSFEHFSEAFRKAGFPLTLKSGKEVQHV